VSREDSARPLGIAHLQDADTARKVDAFLFQSLLNVVGMKDAILVPFNGRLEVPDGGVEILLGLDYV
jgi:hypothetical protein